jgi:uncharacterized protein (DUF952 family)
MPATTRCVLKICSTTEWDAAVRGGAYLGSTDDLRDGYIHLSTTDQAAETARKYFANRRDLVLVAFHTATLGPQLRWEASRGGAQFPHLYAALATASALAALPLALTSDGTPDIAAALAELAAKGYL